MKWTKQEEKCARELFARVVKKAAARNLAAQDATWEKQYPKTKFAWLCVARIHLNRVAKLNREILRLKSCLALAEDCIREQDNKLAGMGAKESAIARFTWTQIQSLKKGATK